MNGMETWESPHWDSRVRCRRREHGIARELLEIFVVTFQAA